MINGLNTEYNKHSLMTILYADDDLDDRELVTEALMTIDPSISCVSVCDGRQLINMLKRTEQLPDLILLDINMPVMDGRECLIEVKKDLRFREVPIIVYSTTDNLNEIGLFYKLGAMFMRKPNSFKELCDSLMKVLRNYRA